MEFNPDTLLSRLHLPAGTARVVVAYSGGMDSSVLLEALARRQERLPGLAAIHVDHGLNAASRRWAEHCRQRCEALDIPFESYGITVDAAGKSLEAAAREARYDVFHDVLEAGDALLTAQHQDDQLETFLLQALRGSGPSGLAAMPAIAPLGQGTLLRPLLDFERAQLESWAQQEAIAWIDDPSNDDESINRNYLRRQVVPLLKARWPAAGQTLSRAARHCGEASELLELLAASDLERSRSANDSLSIDILLPLSLPRQKNLLREWLHLNGIRMPSATRLDHVLAEVISAAPDAMPVVDLGGVEIRRYRGFLYLVTPCGPPRVGQWQDDTFDLGAGHGYLEWQPAAGKQPGIDRKRLAGGLTVRFREGGERLRPAGRRETHDLKKLFQEAAFLPWRREQVPLLYSGDDLVAVGDTWIAEPFAVSGGFRVAWQEKPRLLAENTNHAGE